eukprot:m.360628 g.360628  ORF g.360628 m.360628 type:complete len:410 (-) comp19130_c0_seq1:277-1506(-)
MAAQAPQRLGSVMQAELTPLQQYARTHSMQQLMDHIPRGPWEGNFEFGVELGRGSFGAVTRAIDRTTHRAVAIKRMDITQAKVRSKAHREIHIHLQLKHERIVELLNVYFEEEIEQGLTSRLQAVLVMEALDGGHLLDRIKKVKTFTEADACHITFNMACGLQYLHGKGIAHRDLKPENIVLKTADCEPWDIKIIDFGFASQGELSTPLGSGFYVSPEIITSYLRRTQRLPFDYDTATDIWSLGVITFILLTGVAPFRRVRSVAWYKDRQMHQQIAEANYEYPPSAAGLSDAVKNFVAEMLNPTRAVRIRADGIVNHPLLKRFRPAPLEPVAEDNSGEDGAVPDFDQGAEAPLSRLVSSPQVLMEQPQFDAATVAEIVEYEREAHARTGPAIALASMEEIMKMKQGKMA